MKKTRKILNWILLSVFCQVAVLSYFNFFYLNRRGEAKATLINIDGEKPKKVQTIEVPADAKDIKASYDHSYIAYIKDGKIEINNIKDKETVKTITHKTDQISYYRWLPDRNMIIYGIKAPDNESGRVQVITYNVDSDVEHIYPTITGIPKKSTIDEIELSPLTNVVYAKVLTGNGSAKLYRYNVMSQLSFVMNIADKSVIKGFMYDNKLSYRDEKYRLYMWDGLKSSSKQLQYTGELDLLGISGLNDDIYVAVLDKDKKAKEILYGTYDKPVTNWSKIELKVPVDAGNLYLSPEGDIYELDTLKKTVYDLKTEDKFNYNGNLVEIFSNHIVTREGNKVKIELMK